MLNKADLLSGLDTLLPAPNSCLIPSEQVFYPLSHWVPALLHGAKCFTPVTWFALPTTIAGKTHVAYIMDEETEAQERCVAWVFFVVVVV